MMSGTVSTIKSLAERREQVLKEWESFQEVCECYVNVCIYFYYTNFSNVYQLVKKRREQLEDNLVLQKFLQNADEMEEWMLEKTAIAKDESFKQDSSTTFEVQFIQPILVRGFFFFSF